MTSREELEAVIRRFESYTEADPGNHLLWLELGDAYHRLSHVDQAMASFEKALDLSPGLPTARSRIAAVKISRHRFEEAEQDLKKLVDEGHDDPAILHNLGIAVYYQKRWQDARPYFSAADAAGLKTPANLAYQARCLHGMGDMEQAIAMCRNWEATTNDPASLGYLALLEMDNGNMEEAARLAARTLQHAPDNIDAALVAGTASMEKQDVETASAYFDTVLAKEPDSGRAWLGLGMTHLYNQNPSQAVEALKKAQQLMPENSGTIVALGWAKLSLQDAPGAEQSFREAAAVDPGFAEAYGGLAVALLFQHRTEAAKEAMKIASRLDKNNFGGLYAKGILLKLEGKTELSTRLIANVLDQPPPGGDKPLVEYVKTFAQQRRPTR